MKYFTHAHNIEGCLQNGSFVRKDKDGTLSQYVNGDYMGTINKVPNGMTEVATDFAVRLIPKCCGGKPGRK